MFRTRLLAVMGTALLTAGVPAAGLAADPPVTLRLVVVDTESQTQGAYAEAFIQEVWDRSGGSVTIEPVWSAADGLDGYEQAVAGLLMKGQADLAMVPSRAWDAVGVTSLMALEAPLLIDDPAIAAAVAISPVADDLLGAMEPQGVVGLAMWPVEFTYLVQGGCIDPIVSPDQLAGTVIRAVPSGVIVDDIGTLGASHVFYDDYGADMERCTINALLSGLRRAPDVVPGGSLFTGDVAISPRMDVLAANATSFGRLSDNQRSAIIDAAVATRAFAIADEPTEAEVATTWCDLGGSVVLAGADGKAAFQRALQPVTDRLMADPLAAEAIEAIRDIKAQTTPSPAVSACGPVAVTTAVALPHPDLALYEGTLPPDGTYRAEVTEADLLEKGANPRFAHVQAAVYTLTFEDDTVMWQEGQREPCPNDASSDGTMFSIREQVPDTCLGGDYKWRAVPGGIELVPVVGDWAAQDILDTFALFAREWTRID